MNVTKNQHFVPEFYLRSWNVPGREAVFLYDLENESFSTPNPSSTLVRRYYYEHDRQNPDNWLENILNEMEDRVAPILKRINEVLQHCNLKKGQLERELGAILNLDNQRVLKEFAAYQYLRIPGAIEQKAYELAPAGIPVDVLEEKLKPANFVSTGYDYIRDGIFQKLGMLACYTLDYDLLTSDWPCFDFKDSKDAPHLGEELGRSKEVFLMFPLIPKMLLLLFPKVAFPRSETMNKVALSRMTPGQARNTNTLIIQQANRWIIYNKKEDFIFKVARKRKRGRENR